jgi:uncharacterized protein
MGIAEERTVALTTYRRNGEAVVTPVWINAVSDGRIGFWTAGGTGKTKRLAHNPAVTVQACTARGRIKPGSPVLSGRAEMVTSGPYFDEVHAAGRRKYGLMVPITRTLGRLLGQRAKDQQYGDTVVLIRLDG